MALLPTIGTVSYNGYTFNATTRSSISAEPQYDAARRTVTHVEYVLRLSTYVVEDTPGGGCDTQIAAIRQQLETPRGVLVFSNRGFGDFRINTNGVYDVKGGPYPEAARWTPVGSSACWLLEWSVRVAIPECPSAPRYSGQVMAFNYEVSYSIDADGYTTQTHSGYLEIPIPISGNTVPDTADAYRETIKLPVPLGFRRVVQQFKVSLDKRRLDFTITDEEMPYGGLPEDCTNASGDFSVSSQDEGLAIYHVTLRANYTVSPSRPRSAAWEAFIALFADRAKATYKAGKFPQATAFRLNEGLYLNGREMSFEISYFFPSDITTIMADSGVWRPVPDTDPVTYAASVTDVMGVRGYAGLRNVAGEAIISLCGTPNNPTGPGPRIHTDPQPPTDKVQLVTSGFIDYQCALDVRVGPTTVAMLLLPKTKTQLTTSNTGVTTSALNAGNLSQLQAVPQGFVDPGDFGIGPTPFNAAGAGDFGNALGGLPGGAALANNGDPFQGKLVNGSESNVVNTRPRPIGVSGVDVHQRRTASLHVTLRGYALRVALPSPVPYLSKYRGYPAIAQDPQWRTEWIAGWLPGRVPVYASQWVLRYLVVINS